MSLTVTIERGDQRFGTRWRWEKTANKWAYETGKLFAEAIKHNAPVSKKPDAGRLRDSINFKPKVGARTATVEFYSRVPYANYVVQGTPAHLIEPRRARVLRWEDSGKVVYRRRVHHPGAKQNPFPEKAIRPLIPVASRKMRSIVISELGRL